jgi:transcriptional regulator with XRE-family HTH domain
MTVNERFARFLEIKKLSLKDFSETTGFSYQGLQKFVSGQVSNPKLNLLDVTAKHYPELNIEWLLFEKGDMWKEEILALKREPFSHSSEPSSGKVQSFSTTGRTDTTTIYDDLLKTKDALITSLQEQIEGLRRELKQSQKEINQ